MARPRRGVPTGEQRGSTDAFNAVQVASEESKIVEGGDPFGYKVDPDEKPKPEIKPSDITDEDKTKAAELAAEAAKAEVNSDPFGYKNVEPEPEVVVETDETKPGTPVSETAGDEGELNPYFHLAQGLLKDGFLSGEIADDIDGTALLNTTKDQLREEAIRQITQEANERLETQGYNTEDLRVARMINAGLDPGLLSKTNRYKALGSVDLEKADEKTHKQLLTNWYTDRQWTNKEIEDKLDSLELDEKLAESSLEAKKYFSDKADKLIKEQDEKASIQQAKIEKDNKEQRQLVETLIQKGELLGEKVKDTKAFRASIHNQEYTAEIGGKEYPISELQKFMLEFQNDPETKLWAFNKWRNKDSDVNEIKENLKGEVEEQFLEGYKKIVTKDKSTTTTRRVKDQLTNNNSNSNNGWVSPTGRTKPIIVNH